jgi:TRAP-type C4-dicarboxylate transport system substrate-binding protein
VNMRNALAGVRGGLVDAVMFPPSFVRKELIHTNVVWDTLFFDPDPISSGGAALETVLLHCPECLDDYRKQNAVFITGYATDPQKLFCTKPVRTVAQVKGKRIRGTGVTLRWIKAMGGIPVGMPPTEMVSALERGGIDCVVGPGAWLVAFSLKDVAKHVLDYPMGIPRPLSQVVMNRSTWNDLSAKDKKLILDNVPLAVARGTIEGFVKPFAANREKTKSEGVKFYSSSGDFEKLMKIFLAKELKTIPAVMTKQGATNAQRIVSTVLEITKKWKRLSKEKIKGDVNAYAAAIKSEIYDKIDPNKL